ncbi:MAG: Hsp20/alpha crystallin family protein [Desulfobacter sp.]|nr:MAG: Hsp20/alpha crystallin family protein [Desulfobacter sp.]
MRLVRYNPFNEMTLFKNAFDDFFNDAAPKAAPQCFSPAVDIINRENRVELNVELPGMKKENISVNIEDKVLTISGERKFEEEEKKDNYYRRERRYGSFKRAFTLSDDIITDDVTAEYMDGVLKVILKKDTAKEETKQITVN